MVSIMNSFELRKKFLDFFARNGHTVVPSSSLIPAQDPTLLFANAGMNQFKDIFLGKEKRSYTRATTCQKCVRAGGKHNDLDEVGFTARHLTFFEMLGNFSFGDYFKKEAITYAWTLLTKEIGLPEKDLYVSIYQHDDEAFKLWQEISGLPANRIIRLGEKDNFWQMGDTGPCGPCTEIYVDRGADKGCGSVACAPGCDCPRFTEIWNLVFMQYDRQADGSLKPLKATGVDTGMGLERLTMIVQGKDNVYQTDVFQQLIHQLEKFTGKSYSKADKNLQTAFNVVSEHVRASSMLIADGCTPSNDGRGYVLRKIIRRALLFSQKLSTDVMLLTKLAETFIDIFSPVYPELITSKNLIISLLTSEIERFNTNLIQGQPILEKYIQETLAHNKKQLSGQHIFKLYDTYGFPPELTRVIANEQGLTLDMEGFEAEMLKQQEQSGKKSKETTKELDIPADLSTTFVGYEKTAVSSPITFVQYSNNHIWIVTKESPFYVESGGQASDKGWVTIDNVSYPVVDGKKVGNVNAPAIALCLSREQVTQGTNTKEIAVGDMAHCAIDDQVRANTVKNHTATHLLQAALMKIVGQGIKQAGSSVSDTGLRFDFNHTEALTKEQIDAVETLVNQKIMDDIKTDIFTTTLADAQSQGIIAFFGEKYNPESVRVVRVPGFSAELCGGTHASSTGVIGCCKIISETALSSGTRRIVAVTGPEALKLFQQTYATIKKLSEEFKVKPEEVYAAVAKLNQQQLDTLNHLKQLKKQLYKTQATAWQEQMETTNGIDWLYLTIDGASGDELKLIAQEVEKGKPGFYFIATTDAVSGRTSYIALVTKGAKPLSLKQLAQVLKEKFDWRGGGNDAMIQGGGATLPANLKQAVADWLA
jgi:alanyl-tRNA synthetase